MPIVRKLTTSGFKNYTKKIILPVNLQSLNIFDDNTEITTQVLLDKGLIKGRFDGVKILGNGNLEKKLIIKASLFSESAKEKIESAGGSFEIIQ